MAKRPTKEASSGAAGATPLPMPLTSGELINLVRLSRDRMPKRLQVVADFLISRPREFTVHSITDLAQLMELSPSAIVRFAKGLGFAGFAPMQRLLKTHIIQDPPHYVSLVREMQRPDSDQGQSVGFVLDAFIEANMAALVECRKNLNLSEVEQVVAMLKDSKIIGVVGQKRAFPLAAYFFYGLSMLGCRVLLIDSIGGLARRQAAALRQGDTLVAISFAPYAPEVIESAVVAVESGARVVAITDSESSPLVPNASRVLYILDSNLNGIRAISVTSTVLQAIFVSLGIALESRTPRHDSR